MKTENQPQEQVSQYKGLPKILHSVRWTQHLLAIVAEVLILASFALSGMDVSLGGVMTGIPWLRWSWATAFALGIDTSFVIAWVRVRQCVTTRNWGAFSWNLLLAVGMAFIVFQPVAIQLLQQSLAINFSQALSQLGINITILVYARALVAVLLGAILAMTNVESAMIDQPSSVSSGHRTFLPLKNLLDRYAPVVDTPSVQLRVAVDEEKPEPVQHPIALKAVPAPIERVRQALDTLPNASDRQIAKMSNVSPTTAGKYRKLIEDEQREAGHVQHTEAS